MQQHVAGAWRAATLGRQADDADGRSLDSTALEHLPSTERAVRVEVDEPSEPGLERPEVRPQLVTVQRQSRLQPERVAAREPAGQHPEGRSSSHQAVPQGDGIGALAGELEAVLTRVAGA